MFGIREKLFRRFYIPRNPKDKHDDLGYSKRQFKEISLLLVKVDT